MQKSLPLVLVKAMILKLVKTGSEVPHWFLTGFNDPDVNLVKETTSPDELKLAAEGLSFIGGGDSKEQALAGKYQYHCRKKPTLYLTTQLRHCFNLLPSRNRGHT